MSLINKGLCTLAHQHCVNIINAIILSLIVLQFISGMYIFLFIKLFLLNLLLIALSYNTITPYLRKHPIMCISIHVTDCGALYLLTSEPALKFMDQLSQTAIDTDHKRHYFGNARNFISSNLVLYLLLLMSKNMLIFMLRQPLRDQMLCPMVVGTIMAFLVLT